MTERHLSRVVRVPQPDGRAFADGPPRRAVTALAYNAVKVLCPAKWPRGFNRHGDFAALDTGTNGYGEILFSHSGMIIPGIRIVKRLGG